MVQQTDPYYQDTWWHQRYWDTNINTTHIAKQHWVGIDASQSQYLIKQGVIHLPTSNTPLAIIIITVNNHRLLLQTIKMKTVANNHHLLQAIKIQINTSTGVHVTIIERHHQFTHHHLKPCLDRRQLMDLFLERVVRRLSNLPPSMVLWRVIQKTQVALVP